MATSDAVHIEFEDAEYLVSRITFNRLNKLADIFYQDMGYVSRPNFDYSESPHKTERLMFNMALKSFIFTKKIKPV